MASNPFDALARYYDWEHAGFQDDVAMYLGFAKRTGGPILELGCGTGRLLGVDGSAEMLTVARARLERDGLAQRVALHHADMRSFSLNERFPFAFVALDSFGLLARRSDQHAALVQAARHLLPGGLLVIDVANGNLRGGEPRDELMLQHSGPEPTTGRPLSKWTARRNDLAPFDSTSERLIAVGVKL